jgi:uncharacterized protein (DUF433 family)
MLNRMASFPLLRHPNMPVKGDLNMILEETREFTGIYGIPESAKYLAHTPPFTGDRHVSPAMLRYWIRTSVPYVVPSPFPTRQKLITFLDLISMRMIGVLRSRGLSLREIRNHEKWVKSEFNIEYPFVSRELWTAGSHVYMRFQDRLVASSAFGQQAMEFVARWLTRVELDMEFDPHDVACAWHPFTDVTLNPKIQFGTPCVNGTRIPTRTVWRKLQAGEKPDTLANLYDISIDNINHAVRWERHLEANDDSSALPSGRTVKL